jgi:hypothetical protein
LRPGPDALGERGKAGRRWVRAGRAFGLGPLGKDRFCFFRNYF